MELDIEVNSEEFISGPSQSTRSINVSNKRWQ